MNRGNRKAAIVEDDCDRGQLMRIQIETQKTYGVRILASCPMDNHFHGIVTTPHGNLSDFMEQFESRFAKYSNKRHHRVGHLFQGQYRCVQIEHDVQLLIAVCYVFFNPVSAGMVTKPELYKWSTYAATVGLAPCPSYLSIDWLGALFPNRTLEQAQARFHQLMTDGDPVYGYLNDHAGEAVDRDALRRVVRSYVGEQLQLATLPQIYRSVLRSSLTELFAEDANSSARANAIYEAYVTHGYKLAEIARHLRVNPSTISKIYRRILESRREGEK
ncbi:MAG: transposase [Cyanobacteria bacterium]|nr:transposase [Cyanobacteriota bacterium]